MTKVVFVGGELRGCIIGNSMVYICQESVVGGCSSRARLRVGEEKVDLKF